MQSTVATATSKPTSARTPPMPRRTRTVEPVAAPEPAPAKVGTASRRAPATAPAKVTSATVAERVPLRTGTRAAESGIAIQTGIVSAT